MSTAARGSWVPARVAHSFGTAIVVALGLALLLARVRMLSLDGDVRTIVLAAVLGSVAAASMLMPVPVGSARLPRPLVLLVGLAGVAGAALAAGRPAAFPAGAWAIPLALLAALAEESLFRRVLYARLEPAGPAVAIVVTAVLFAAIHVPLYGWAALPVDLGAGLVLSWQRWASGDWTVPAATHAAGNLLAVVMR